ncbi:Enoyl-CoA hydratase/carnithine racemase [Geodermatophilus telluris]|uniref:Enoyl-CoA hydratase/carnithine racemase n=1 Tax=Geodermatophilus telluris TaxID=1190417 RepID=A0A1G6TLE5_9ACTN|nr:enoyl-CoA hydratase/isomerase family protein [Geodermatophilus telluris]SDD29870.1 Enoyl-CoA hydratase/carnithine racemase [Geodermatophilus telluris]
MAEFLRVTVRDRVGWIEYDRPPVNAFHWEMLREVPEALEQHLADPAVRVVVVGSALEAHFSVGADLRVFADTDDDGMRRWVDACHDLVRRVRAAPKPLLAAVHGTAVGGGLEIVLHCDVRFAASTARLGQPEIGIGFLPPVGATQALARLLGRPRALRLLYDGTLLSAEEALAIGLVDVVVAPERLREEVQGYAEGLARKPARALAAIRRCVTEGVDLPFAEGLAIEREEAVALGATADFREGLAAFLDRRPPVWSD